MPVGWTWSGAQTEDGFTVTASLGATVATACTLIASTNSDLSSPVTSSSVAVDANGYVKLPITGLEPDTRYYYGVKIDGVLDPWRGRCRTFPPAGVASSFTFGFTSCAFGVESGLVSHSPAWKRVTDRDLLFLAFDGDWNYSNPSANNQATIRGYYETTMTSAERRRMMANCALPYMWDNHDFGDPNGDGSDPSKPAVSAVYRQIVPSYPLPAGTGNNPIYHDFPAIGRTRVIVTDQRWATTPQGVNGPTSTLLGTTQKAWLKQKWLDYRDEGTQVIFWISEKSWYATGSESWSGGYTTERDELAVFAEANNIPPVVILSGDLHASRYMPGASLTPGGRAFPEHVASPFDQTMTNLEDVVAPCASGPWYNRIGNSQYATVEVHDDELGFWWVVNGWRCRSGVRPDYNLYRVDSRTPNEAPQMKLGYVRDSDGTARPLTSGGAERPLYVPA